MCSVAPHTQNLRSHGMSDEPLAAIYKALVIVMQSLRGGDLLMCLTDKNVYTKRHSS